jgi:hypothetical protein
MADLAMITFPATVFVGDDFWGTVLGQNFGHDLGSGDNGFTNLDLGLLGEKEDVGDLGGGARFTRKAFHLKGIAFANLVLFSTCPNDGERWHKNENIRQKPRKGKGGLGGKWKARSGKKVTRFEARG